MITPIFLERFTNLLKFVTLYISDELEQIEKHEEAVQIMFCLFPFTLQMSLRRWLVCFALPCKLWILNWQDMHYISFITKLHSLHLFLLLGHKHHCAQPDNDLDSFQREMKQRSFHSLSFSVLYKFPFKGCKPNLLQHYLCVWGGWLIEHMFMLLTTF